MAHLQALLSGNPLRIILLQLLVCVRVGTSTTGTGCSVQQGYGASLVLVSTCPSVAHCTEVNWRDVHAMPVLIIAVTGKGRGRRYMLILSTCHSVCE